MEGFVVKISICLDDSEFLLTPMNMWKGFFHPHDIVLNDLTSIRDFIVSKEHWKISVDEHVLFAGSNVPYPLADVEVDWFDCEASRLRVRTPLIGYFSNYSTFIDSQSEMAMTLSRGSDQEQTFCEWNGIVEDLIRILRGLDITQTDLKLWILRYFRCHALKLSVAECDAIVCRIIAVDSVAAVDDDFTVQTDQLPTPSPTENQWNSEIDQQSIVVTAKCCEIQPTAAVSAPRTMSFSFTSNNEQILHGISMLLQGQQATWDRLVEDSRKVHAYPLLAVLSPYQSTGFRGAAKAFAGAKLGITTCRVRFHCSVCGCQSLTAGKGYKLQLGSKGTKYILKVFRMSLSMLQLMLQIGGVPNQVSAIAEFAITSLDILSTDLRDEFLKIAEVQDNDELRRSLIDVKNAAVLATAASNTPVQRSVLLDPTKTVSR